MSGDLIGSTNIDDLPGLEETPVDYIDDRTSQMANMNNNVNVNLNRHTDVPRVIKSNVTANIKKLKQEVLNHESYYDMVMSFVNKDNILLLVILYIACLRQSDEYTRKFLLNIPFNLANNSIASTIIKCIVLLIIYLIIKEHI